MIPDPFATDHLIEIAYKSAAVGAFIVSVWNSFKIKEVHLIMNSRLDQLLKAIKAEGFQEGAANERQSGVAALAATVESTALAAAKVLDTAATLATTSAIHAAPAAPAPAPAPAVPADAPAQAPTTIAVEAATINIANVTKEDKDKS